MSNSLFVCSYIANKDDSDWDLFHDQILLKILPETVVVELFFPL